MVVTWANVLADLAAHLAFESRSPPPSRAVSDKRELGLRASPDDYGFRRVTDAGAWPPVCPRSTHGVSTPALRPPGAGKLWTRRSLAWPIRSCGGVYLAKARAARPPHSFRFVGLRLMILGSLLAACFARTN